MTDEYDNCDQCGTPIPSGRMVCDDCGRAAAAEAFFGGEEELYDEWLRSGADWPSQD